MLSNKNAPLIYLITDGTAGDESFAPDSNRILDLIQAAVHAEIEFVQLREKNLSPRNVYKLAQKAVELTQNSLTQILINDRADIAIAADAHGVHLTSNSITADVARQNFGANFIIGVSCHTLAEVQQAQTDGANFATFSPIFATPSKTKYGAPQGLEKLREVCRNVQNFPIIALGGINETNFAQTLQAEASGIAAISWLNDAQNLMKNITLARASAKAL